MLKRAKAGRRPWFFGGLTAAVAVLAAGIAFGAAPIVATDNTYSAPTYTINQGEVPTFQDMGLSMHNVTARTNGPDGQALFRSGTISGGSSAQVAGTQYLTSGTYTFYCTIHPTEMQATLVVGPGGTPQARPHATLAVRTKTISKAVKKGLLVAIDMSAKTDGVSLVAKLGRATVGKANDISTAAGQQFAVLKLTKSGKSKLRGRSKATVMVTATVPFGPTSSTKAKLK